jgi:hypothetical protein
MRKIANGYLRAGKMVPTETMCKALQKVLAVDGRQIRWVAAERGIQKHH